MGGKNSNAKYFKENDGYDVPTGADGVRAVDGDYQRNDGHNSGNIGNDFAVRRQKARPLDATEVENDCYGRL